MSPESTNVMDLDAARTIADLRRQLAEKSAEVAQLREQLEAHALSDDLTSLANRKGFYVLAEHALRHAGRRGIACLAVKLDVDGLARINEQFGHTQGDKLLADVGKLLRATFRASDVLARIDGDEFCVLVQDPGDDAHVIRRRIEEKVAALNARKTRPYALGVHIAIVCSDPDNKAATLDELLQRADADLYAQKHRRRPRSAA